MPTKPKPVGAPSGAQVVPLFRHFLEDVPEVELGDSLDRESEPESPFTTASVPVDMTGKSPVWFLIGPGGAGKTLEARWLNWRLSEHGRAASLVALDPANRSLTSWFDNVLQPPSRDGTHIARWLVALLDTMMKPDQPIRTALFDFGGGDVALGRAVQSAPAMLSEMEKAGLGVVACYALTPRIDDLGPLAAMEKSGFQPPATVLLLNQGRADPTLPRSESFAAITRHSVFRNAVARGAQVVWMPALESDVMAEIDAKRLDFTSARDGLVPEGARFSPLGGLRRSMVGRWLERMEQAHAPLTERHWLP